MPDLRALLGSRYNDVIERAADALAKSASTDDGDGGTWAIDAAAVLTAVLPDLMAESWDEGRWGEHTTDCRWSTQAECICPNPYRAEETR